MSKMPRKCLRRCSGCGEERLTMTTNHKIMTDGIKRQCGIFRVADRPQNIQPLRTEEE